MALLRPGGHWVLLGALLLGIPRPLGAQGVRASEYQVKALFLFNFVQFVDWPPDAFPDHRAPLVIGILGSDPFGPLLDDIVQGEQQGSRPLVIRRYDQVEDIVDCHVLFLSRSESDRMGEIPRHLARRPILTVSDATGFVDRGGIIGLVTERNRVRFRVNLTAARLANLSLSSKLLRLAEVVMPEER